MLLYYKYLLKNQFLLKYPEFNMNTVMLKKMLFEVYLDSMKTNYYIYLYNIAVLLRIILNKFLYMKKIDQKFKLSKMYMGMSLVGNSMYQFLDMFTFLLLPLFESFNVVLDMNKFDVFGNLQYQLIYCDPVFMSKNMVTVWSSLYSVNLKFCFNTLDKMLNYNILQQLKFKWYF